jgi:hypothetical protein
LSAFNTAQETLESINIPLVPLSTNYRSIIELNWNLTHGTALASCLNNFKRRYSTGIIAGTFSYKYEFSKYISGSNPITDPLLSSSSLKILHDGAKYYRDKKVIGISKWNQGVNNLRVCYSGKQKHINCGKCEKCIRTKMIFEAHGRKIPESFPSLTNGKTIRKLFIRTQHLDKGYIITLRLSKVKNNKISFKWSYYYLIYKSRIIRGILKPKIVRNIGRKLYHIFKRRK